MLESFILFLVRAVRRSVIDVAGEALEALQFTALMCAALALVVVGPLFWIHHLVIAQRLGWAAVVAAAWLASAIIVGRDLWRKRIGLVSFGLFLTWLIILVWVFNDRFFV